MDVPSGLAIHCFVRLRRNAIEARGFANFQFVDGSIDFLKGDGDWES
jgi:hypothetical protein